MGFLILLLIFSFSVLVLLEYLIRKYKVKTLFVILIIITINILFYGSLVIIGHISEIKLENKFNELFQLYDKDHPNYGFLKNYDTLTDEEKQIWDQYFGDGGRISFRYIGMPILCMLNILFLIVLTLLLLKNEKEVKFKKELS